jgi:hypothetical protein
MKIVKALYIDDTIVTIGLDRWNLFAFYIFCENKVYNIDINDLKENLGAPCILTENKIRCACVSQKYILTGHDEGNIYIWERLVNGLYKHINSFSQHKGTITNLISINRPISQYGLNFNANIEETIIKPLKKQNTPLTTEISLHKSTTKQDYIERYLNRKRNNTKLRQEPIISKISNLDDNDFLKKKLNELYSLLNNH